MTILNRHIVIRFLNSFLLCIIGVIVIFIIVDLVENVDRFIDSKVPWHIVSLYYMYNVPYIVVLTLPMATILATTLLVGSMASKNETVAMKALGYSYYQLLTLLLWIGICISLASFVLAEVITTQATRSRVEIEREYLKKHLDRDRTLYQNLAIQEPPYWHITMVEFNSRTNQAQQVSIFRLDNDSIRIKNRYDVTRLSYQKGRWIVNLSGEEKENKVYERIFQGIEETKAGFIQDSTLVFPFKFTPRELIQVKIISEEKSIVELYRIAMKIRASGGKTHKWMTDVHLRIAFPMSNIFVIFICVPLVYNRQKKSVVEGVGISLLICFVYFGLIKMGQTLGHKKELAPFIGAWMGNGLAMITGFLNLYWVRK